MEDLVAATIGIVLMLAPAGSPGRSARRRSDHQDAQ